MDSSAWWQAHLEANLLSVHPTAMGWIPPSFFDKAIRFAPKKRGRMDGGVLPSRIKVIRPTNEDNRGALPSPAVGPVRSLRCWGRRPSGPPPDPAGNVVIAFRISSVVIGNGNGELKSILAIWESG